MASPNYLHKKSLVDLLLMVGGFFPSCQFGVLPGQLTVELLSPDSDSDIVNLEGGKDWIIFRGLDCLTFWFLHLLLVQAVHLEQS